MWRRPLLSVDLLLFSVSCNSSLLSFDTNYLCKMGRMMGGLMLLLLCATMHAMAQELLDVTGSTIKFEASFDMIDADSGISYQFGFFFGNGWSGDNVRTGTEVTLGRDGNTSQIFACRDGKMILIDRSTGTGTPEDALLRVRYNSTGDSYRIEITESSNSALQLAYCSDEGILCSENPGTPILFRLNSADYNLHKRRAYAALM